MFISLLVLVAMLISWPVFAEVPQALDAMPATAVDLLGLLANLPTVGPWLVIAVKWIGLIGGIFTAASVGASTILHAVAILLASPEVIAVWGGKEPSQISKWVSTMTLWADKVLQINAKIQPYLKWLSVFNVQKKK